MLHSMRCPPRIQANLEERTGTAERACYFFRLCLLTFLANSKVYREVKRLTLTWASDWCFPGERC